MPTHHTEDADYDLTDPKAEQRDTRVGPVIFSHPIPHGHLQGTGSVVSFRSGSKRTTGRTHWRRGRNLPGEGPVEIWCVEAVDASDPADLRPYIDNSGFASVEAWQHVIEELHGDLPLGHVYHVRTLAEGGTR